MVTPSRLLPITRAAIGRPWASRGCPPADRAPEEPGASTLPTGMRKEYTQMADKPSRGPADVIAASTPVSDIDGRAGLLFYRGYDIHQLAGGEQHADSRPIRPDSEYIGERGLTWIPAGQR
jgi:hypothetical protein